MPFCDRRTLATGWQVSQAAVSLSAEHTISPSITTVAYRAFCPTLERSDSLPLGPVVNVISGILGTNLKMRVQNRY
jgi:hypothetical protein